MKGALSYRYGLAIYNLQWLETATLTGLGFYLNDTFLVEDLSAGFHESPLVEVRALYGKVKKKSIALTYVGRCH